MKHRIMKLYGWLLPLSMSVAILSSCGDIQPLWKGERKLTNYTLYYSEPCEFNFELKNIAPETRMTMEMVITYYVGISRTEVPLFLIFEDKDHNVKEFTSKLLLKEEGEWMGIPEQNEIDYTLSHFLPDELSLSPGKYTLKIYANDEQQEKVYGIVKIGIRFYELEVPGQESL